MSNNRFLSRFAPVAAAAVLAAAAALASSGAASGSEDEEPLTPTTSAIGGETAEDAATRAELRELATRQTVEEIQRIVGSAKPVVALYDIETNTYLAAKLVGPFSKAAITPRGPGCATTDVCATGANNYGYYGTGALNINLSGITKIFSGDHSTTWWQGAKGTIQMPNVTLLFPSPGATLTAITRS